MTMSPSDGRMSLVQDSSGGGNFGGNGTQQQPVMVSGGNANPNSQSTEENAKKTPKTPEQLEKRAKSLISYTFIGLIVVSIFFVVVMGYVLFSSGTVAKGVLWLGFILSIAATVFGIWAQIQYKSTLTKLKATRGEYAALNLGQNSL